MSNIINLQDHRGTVTDRLIDQLMNVIHESQPDPNHPVHYIIPTIALAACTAMVRRIGAEKAQVEGKRTREQYLRELRGVFDMELDRVLNYLDEVIVTDE